MRLIKPGDPLYTIEETWLESYVPRSGAGFIDCGANLCTWTKWLAPGYKFVHVVEPFQEAIDAAGTLPENAKLHLVGAWSEEAQIHFGVYSPSHLLFAQEGCESWFSEIGTNGPIGPNSLVLPCQTLDSLVPEKDEITFIKVDVEGSEYQVMLGASEIIRQSHPFMIVEIHSRLNGPKIEEMLRAENYEIEIVRSPFDAHQNTPHWHNHYWLVCSPAR
jgi:FkbM family methyltransferase